MSLLKIMRVAISEYRLRLKKFEVFMCLYILLTILFFALFAFKDVYNTTELGSQYNTLHMYADHPTYVNYYRYFNDNIILFLLLKINYLGPFFVIWLTGDNLIFAFIFNLICLVLSIKIIHNLNYFNMERYSTLLLINPITFLSMFSVNKEILSLLAVSLFLLSLIKPRKLYFFLALLVSFLARKELSLLLIALYFIFYYLPNWNKYKILLYASIILLISIGSFYINKNFSAISGYNIEVENAVDEAGSRGTILILNNIQNEYGYYLVVIPKILLNLYGSVLSRTSQMIFFDDVYNDIVVWGQSFLFLYILPKGIYSYLKNMNILSCKLIFSFTISCIMFSYIPVVQNRYFYTGYLFLIALIAIRKSSFVGNNYR